MQLVQEPATNQTQRREDLADRRAFGAYFMIRMEHRHRKPTPIHVSLGLNEGIRLIDRMRP